MPKKSETTYLGKYEILEKIGEGGFGIVYRGHDPLLDRPVAIKLLKSEAAASPEFVERFRREARLAAALRHPNIVNVIDVGEQEGRLFLVMDLLLGGTLSALLKDGKPLPISRAIELLKPVAEALDYAHRKGMIHRDVKPSNIILNEDGQPVLTDFGLGKSLTEIGISTTGTPLGTAEYMAPEQILGKTPGPSTDTYALGVIAYQMLSGQVPFSGTTPYTIQKGHAEGVPPDPREANPGLSEKTAGVLLKALEKEPEKRYQSGAELAAALAEAANYEKDVHSKELYDQARAAMEKREFAQALQTWQALLETNPTFQDAAEQARKARQQVELVERYEELVKQADALKAEAQAILAVDAEYPDRAEVFVRVGARPFPPTQPRQTKSEVKSEEIKLGVWGGWSDSGSTGPTSLDHYSARDETGDELASKEPSVGLTVLLILSVFGSFAGILIMGNGELSLGVSILLITSALWAVFFVRRNKTKNKSM